MARLAIGIDLGGTDIKGGLVKEDGTLLARFKKPTVAQSGGEKVVERIGDLIEEIRQSEVMRNEDHTLLGIGMGSPGLIDHEKGSITRPVNIPKWDHWICVNDVFQKRFGLKTWVDNDANVSALGEALFGNGKGKNPVLVLTLGTGVGGGIVIDGKVLHGKAGFAGELGHIMVNPDGPVCGCGNEGCLETYASASAIARYAQSRSRVEHVPTKMRELAGGIEKITSKTVYDAAVQGDEEALSVIAHAGKYLGIGISSLIMAFNPEVICLGGGAANMGDILLDHARHEVNWRCFFDSHFRTPIIQAKLGEEAGVVGAAGQVFAAQH